MSDQAATQKQLVEQIDAVLVAVDKLRDQVLTLKRKAEGINPVREALAYFDELWIAAYQHGVAKPTHYEFNRTVDPASVKRWLKTMDVNTLKRRIARYFGDRDPFLVRNKHPFNLFIKNFNTYTPGTSAAPAQLDAPPRSQLADCKHQPPCVNDVQHTQRRQRELRTVD